MRMKVAERLLGMQRSDVPWADYRWNPLRGCSGASAGCEHCYARTWWQRFGGYFGLPPWGKPMEVPAEMRRPERSRKPGLVFVCSTSDVYHADVDPVYRSAMMAQMGRAYWHTFILLTKRPHHIPMGAPWFPNIWLGVSTENQEMFDLRWQQLGWALRGLPLAWPLPFISAEPLLGPITLGSACPSWVIAGPETGRGARPMDPQWILDLENECVERGIPFFDKRGHAGARREFPAGRSVQPRHACLFCGRSFVSNGGLNMHLTKTHGKEK